MPEHDPLTRIAIALEALQQHFIPSIPQNLRIHDDCDCYLWQAEGLSLKPIFKVARVELSLLKGIDKALTTLLSNTKSFALGHPANNALLWGARGMGKSSAVKAVHAHVAKIIKPRRLLLVEVARENIASLDTLLPLIAELNAQVLLFCDDLSFEYEDATYKALKSALDGGLMQRPPNLLFYATSNRRHLMARQMIENESHSAINPSEATEEKVSLSDRFGLWLGFHRCDQKTYLAMINAYTQHFKLGFEPQGLERRALEWAMARGGRSGRVAWQFIQHIRAEDLSRSVNAK